MTTGMTIEDRPAQSRFVLIRDGEELGEAAYARRDGEIEFTHTVIDEEKREKGMGSALVAGALDQVRSSGDRVVPQCPFVKDFIDEHAEYQDLLA